MADTAFMTQYRQEFIAGFEQKQSLLRQSVTSEAVIKGNQAVFLVADSGGATAVTRGVNGLIPARADHLVQNTATSANTTKVTGTSAAASMRVRMPGNIMGASPSGACVRSGQLHPGPCPGTVPHVH